MATYEIDKITFTDGNVCEIRDDTRFPESEYNYIINSLPYCKGDTWSENWWSLTCSPTSSATYGMGHGEFQAQLTSSCTSFNIIKVDMELTMLNDVKPKSGIDLSQFHDGDPAMVSFEYQSDAEISAIAYCETYSRPTQTSYSYTGDPKVLPASSVWKRVYFKGEIPSGWDTKYSANISADMRLKFTPTGATNLKVRRVSLTKSPTEAQWLPNPQDVVGEFNHDNYIINGSLVYGLSYKMGTIGTSNSTGCSVAINNNHYGRAICSTYDSTIEGGQRSRISFLYQSAEHIDEGALCNLIWSGWNDGDPFTCSVEVRSTADFYVDACPRTKFLTDQDYIQPWELGDHKTLVRGDDKWHRVWISGIIPDGFMQVAQDYESYDSRVSFGIYYTQAQTVLFRKFMFTKGLQRTDWIPGMMDSPGRIMYYDDTTATSYTIGSSNYTQITRPSVIPKNYGIVLVNIAPLDWASTSGTFSIQTYPLQDYCLLVGAANTPVNNLKLRWYYTFNDVSGFEAAYS